MPTPIFKVNIDDAAFKRFIDTFNKYQESLKAQPEMWKSINSEIGNIAFAGGAIAAEIARQGEETRKLATEERKRNDERRRNEKEKSDAARAERELQKARKKMWEDDEKKRKENLASFKQFTRTVRDVGADLGKWAIGGGAAGLIGGALSLWGADSFIHSVGDSRRSAMGLGTTIGGQQSSNLFLQRFFDVNSVLENVANAQGTPASWGAFRMMGVNPTGKDPAELTSELALSAARMFRQDRGNLALAGAQGLTQFFSPDDLRRLAAEDPKVLQRAITDSRKFAKDDPLRDSIALKWQNLSVALDHTTLLLKNTLINELTKLMSSGALDTIITKFGDLAVNVLDRIDWERLGDGLDTFGKYIGSAQFQTDFKTFADDVSLVANKLVDTLALLGIIPTPSNPGGPAPAGVQNFGTSGVPSGKGSISTFFGGYVGSGLHEMEANNYGGNQFKKAGWTENQAKGILANLDAESGMNPFAQGDKNKAGQFTAYGIGQWHSDRQAMYAKIFGHTMQSVKDPAQALREQLEFVQWELTHTFKKAGDDIRKQRSAFGAAFVASKEYERPAGGNATATARGLRASTNVTIRNQTGASVATTVNSAANG